MCEAEVASEAREENGKINSRRLHYAPPEAEGELQIPRLRSG
jgi:hypothetical protein